MLIVSLVVLCPVSNTKAMYTFSWRLNKLITLLKNLDGD